MHICLYDSGPTAVQYASRHPLWSCSLTCLACAPQLEELQKVKIPTSIKVTPIRGGILDNWD